MDNRYNIAAEQREDREDTLIDQLKMDMEIISMYLYSTMNDLRSTGMAEKEIKRLTGLEFDIANYMLEAEHEHCGDMIRDEMSESDAIELAGDIIEHVFSEFGAEIIAYHERLTEERA